MSHNTDDPVPIPVITPATPCPPLVISSNRGFLVNPWTKTKVRRTTGKEIMGSHFTIIMRKGILN